MHVGLPSGLAASNDALPKAYHATSQAKAHAGKQEFSCKVKATFVLALVREIITWKYAKSVLHYLFPVRNTQIEP
jgi:hypothetical protein